MTHNETTHLYYAPRDMFSASALRTTSLLEVTSAIPRLEFYERAKSVFAVVHTLEAAPYSVFILRKGVIFTSN